MTFTMRYRVQTLPNLPQGMGIVQKEAVIVWFAVYCGFRLCMHNGKVQFFGSNHWTALKASSANNAKIIANEQVKKYCVCDVALQVCERHPNQEVKQQTVLCPQVSGSIHGEYQHNIFLRDHKVQKVWILHEIAQGGNI